MEAAIWAINPFCLYLHGQSFTLLTNHKPLEKLEHAQARSLNQIEQAMQEFNFWVTYKKGPRCQPTLFLRTSSAQSAHIHRNSKSSKNRTPYLRP